MAWQVFSALTLNGEWVYSPAIEGELFRLTHTYSEGFYGRGLICQASENEPRDLFEVTRFYAKPQNEIYRFIAPTCFASRAIGLRGYYQSEGAWTVSLEVWL